MHHVSYNLDQDELDDGEQEVYDSLHKIRNSLAETVNDLPHYGVPLNSFTAMPAGGNRAVHGGAKPLADRDGQDASCKPSGTHICLGNGACPGKRKTLQFLSLAIDSRTAFVRQILL